MSKQLLTLFIPVYRGALLLQVIEERKSLSRPITWALQRALLAQHPEIVSTFPVHPQPP